MYLLLIVSTKQVVSIEPFADVGEDDIEIVDDVSLVDKHWQFVGVYLESSQLLQDGWRQ